MTLNAEEQYLLELINRARLDPVAEAARYGIDLNQGLAAGTLTGGSRQVLAANPRLEQAAVLHSRWMLDQDVFSHSGAGGSQPWHRATAQGYAYSNIGENISWRGNYSGWIPGGTAVLLHHEGLFRSAGHRVNLLNDTFREVGIAREDGVFRSGGTNYNASMLTELFGRSGSLPILTGVVYSDLDQDRFYSIGEGRSGASFTVGSATAGSSAAGGYALSVAASAALAVAGVTPYGMRFTLTVDMSQGNVKLDLVNGVEFLTSGSLALGTGIARATLLGLDDLQLFGSTAANTLTGNAGANRLVGFAGNDTISGGAGNDTMEGGPGSDRLLGGLGADLIRGGSEADVLDGGSGNDTLIGGNQADVLTGGLGADVFRFNDAGGADRVTDFRLAERDRLAFDDGLWNGASLTRQQVVDRYAHVTAEGVRFDFGADGSVLLAGVTSLNGLANAIDIF